MGIERYAILDKNSVVTHIEKLPEGVKPAGTYVVSDAGQVGQKYDSETGEFHDYTPVPAAVSMRQARLQLHRDGLLSQVVPTLESLSEPDKSEALIEWEYAQTVDRDSSLVNSLMPAIGLDEAQTDDLFIKAAKI